MGAQLFAGAFAALPPFLVGADAATGVVVGQVFNEATGDVLSAAVITLDGSEGKISAVTGTDGTFRIVVPEGASTLIASYPGLDDTCATAVVTASRTVSRDISMNSSIDELEAFVVKGLREGQVAAIQGERQAVNIRAVAAVHAFGNPASSAGKLFQRLTGVAVDEATRAAGNDWLDPANYIVKTRSSKIVFGAPADRPGARADFQKDFQAALPVAVNSGLKENHFEQLVDRQLCRYLRNGDEDTIATGRTPPGIVYHMTTNEGLYGPFPFLQIPGPGLPGGLW